MAEHQHDLKDYLLLDYVDLYWCPIKFFFSNEAGEVFNKPPHHLSTYQLIARLRTLLVGGLLVLKQGDQINDAPSEQTIDLLFADYPESNNKVCLGMSVAGGKLWENAFNPKWDKYCRLSEGRGAREIVLETRTDTYLNEVLSVYTKCFVPFDTPMNIERISPWDATYWKRFETGYRVQFAGQELDEEAVPQNLRFSLEKLRVCWRLQWGTDADQGLLNPDEWLRRVRVSGVQ